MGIRRYLEDKIKRRSNREEKKIEWSRPGFGRRLLNTWVPRSVRRKPKIGHREEWR